MKMKSRMKSKMDVKWMKRPTVNNPNLGIQSSKISLCYSKQLRHTRSNKSVYNYSRYDTNYKQWVAKSK